MAIQISKKYMISQTTEHDKHTIIQEKEERENKLPKIIQCKTQITMKQISISDFATVEKWLHMKIVAGSRNHENNSKAQTTTTQQNIKFGKDSGKYLKSNYFGLLFFFNRLPNFRNNGFFFL